MTIIRIPVAEVHVEKALGPRLLIVELTAPRRVGVVAVVVVVHIGQSVLAELKVDGKHAYGLLHGVYPLAESRTDPRREIAEALCRDIPADACVTAFNKKFECSRLRELADTFPNLAEHLRSIADHIVDLLDPFQKGYYYRREIGGSFSIKSVLPAICPNDPELDYHELEGVHNGTEAMSVFPEIQYMEPEEQQQARKNLLAYCRLDTLAMVKVWEELRRAAGC